jgi:o-succinylbenzoate synthase
VSTPPAPSLAAPEPLTVSAVELRLVELPLVEPFETSFGVETTRLVFLVRMEAAGSAGFGEIVAGRDPLFSYETVETARHVLREFLVPALVQRPLTSLADLAVRLARFRGHPMAKAGLELAFVDLVARLRDQPLSRVLGGTRARVPVGVSLGIQKTLPALLERVERHLVLGYQRIKLKIKPAWDVEVVREVRRCHPGILLSVDANAAYTLADRDHLARLDDMGLLMIEQPLAHDDLVEHAELQRSLRTALCLDESITGLSAARAALALGSCRILNMKVGRVGGYSQALPIHDLCVERGVPLWCGGMLESGIGRAHNLALASLPGFTLPGDISASRRYFEQDVIRPAVLVAADGTIEVPGAPGLGFDVDHDFIESRTIARERLSV